MGGACKEGCGNTSMSPVAFSRRYSSPRCREDTITQYNAVHNVDGRLAHILPQLPKRTYCADFLRLTARCLLWVTSFP